MEGVYVFQTPGKRATRTLVGPSSGRGGGGVDRYGTVYDA